MQAVGVFRAAPALQTEQCQIQCKKMDLYKYAMNSWKRSHENRLKNEFLSFHLNRARY